MKFYVHKKFVSFGCICFTFSYAVSVCEVEYVFSPFSDFCLRSV
jgi:hypothetical protein